MQVSFKITTLSHGTVTHFMYFTVLFFQLRLKMPINEKYTCQFTYPFLCLSTRLPLLPMIRLKIYILNTNKTVNSSKIFVTVRLTQAKVYELSSFTFAIDVVSKRNVERTCRFYYFFMEISKRHKPRNVNIGHYKSYIQNFRHAIKLAIGCHIKIKECHKFQAVVKTPRCPLPGRSILSIFALFQDNQRSKINNKPDLCHKCVI